MEDGGRRMDGTSPWTRSPDVHSAEDKVYDGVMGKERGPTEDGHFESVPVANPPD